MSCGPKVQSALKTVDWIDSASIECDRNTMTARFVAKDKSKFDLETLKKVVSEKAGPKYQVSRVLKKQID
jgi:copper chaperone CopZ